MRENGLWLMKANTLAGQQEVIPITLFYTGIMGMPDPDCSRKCSKLLTEVNGVDFQCEDNWLG
jgi:hypothetical protein